MTASCRASSMRERASQNWAPSLAKSQEIQRAPSASRHLLSGVTDGFNFRQSPRASERPGRGRTVRPSWQRGSEVDRAEVGFVSGSQVEVHRPADRGRDVPKHRSRNAAPQQVVHTRLRHAALAGRFSLRPAAVFHDGRNLPHQVGASAQTSAALYLKKPLDISNRISYRRGWMHRTRSSGP